jgi:hypothetical protein
VGLSSKAYDQNVVGVISGAGGLSAGLTLAGSDETEGSLNVTVALVGQVYVRASEENGHVFPGDLLVSSSVPGIAMQAEPGKFLLWSIIGKAIRESDRSDESGHPLILILVMNK